MVLKFYEVKHLYSYHGSFPKTNGFYAVKSRHQYLRFFEKSCQYRNFRAGTLVILHTIGVFSNF